MATATQRNVVIMSGMVRLEGMLDVPQGARGVVLFAHGSGSGRFSTRNQFVARELRDEGIGTLLFDLLEDEEANDRRKVFDIGLLAERLLSATTWIHSDSETKDLDIGYFGASTGAAAALTAAAMKGDDIKAVVSRGGRPDLAMNYLSGVTAPVLLIVGGEDYQVIEMNREAFNALPGEKDMEIVPGATHLFEEPGTLEQVAALAREWFSRFLK